MLGYVIINRNHFSRFLSVRKLGIIERDLTGLKQVIVLADRIERPHSTLAEAVEDNFSEGVHYLFLISNSNAENEMNGYYQIFEALARISADKSDIDTSASDLVDIKKLPYDWPDVPYIFYRFQEENDKKIKTLAFRGNQKKEGIADFYEKLSGQHSQAMVQALLAEAPQEIAHLKALKKVKFIDGQINSVS